MISDEVNNKVVAIVNETLEKARKMWPSKAHLITPLIVGWENKKVGTAGLAYMGRGKVTFNPTYIDQKDFWETTIVHEVAHHIQRWIYPTAKQAHGPEFRYIMSLFGRSGRTHHKMVTEAYKEKHPHEYVCPTCNRSIFVSDILHQRLQIRPRYCTEKNCKRVHKSKNYVGCAIYPKNKLTKEVPAVSFVPRQVVESVKVQNVQPVLQPTQPKKVHGPASLADILGLNPHWK